MAMNMSVHIEIQHTDFDSSGYVPSSEIAEIYGSPFFKFLRNFYTVSIMTINLHSHLLCVRVIFFSISSSSLAISKHGI